VLGGVDSGRFRDKRQCYCDVSAIAERAPTDEEFESLFEAKIEALNLPSIIVPTDPSSMSPLDSSEPSASEGFTAILEVTQVDFVDGCNTTNVANFTTTVVVVASADLFNATANEIVEFEQAFLESFNQAALNNEICDHFFRVIREVEAQADFSLNRRLQQGESDTLAPTAAPTDTFGSEPALIEILLVITGSCIGCAPDQNLFDQVSLDRRDLKQKTVDLKLSLSVNSTKCLCPDDVPNRGPSNSEVFDVFSTRVQDVDRIIEVDPVDCPEQVDFFESSVTVFWTLNKIELSDKDAIGLIEESFVCSYNELLKEYCNPEFRTVISAKCIEEVSFETVVSFTFAVEGRCRGGCRFIWQWFFDLSSGRCLG
jgi:hypothetical protein